MKTKNKIMMLCLATLLGVSMTACSDDDAPVKPEDKTEAPAFVLGQESVEVKIGAENKVTVEVKTGGGEYDAFILDERVARAEVTKEAIKVEGLINGTTSLLVSDKYNRYRRLPINVYTTDKLELSHEKFDLVTPLGNPRTLAANVKLGNGGYSVKSDNEAVKVTVNEAGEISLTATSKKDPFTAKVTVTDVRALTAEITVVVTSTLEAFSSDDIKKFTTDATKRYYHNNQSQFGDKYFNEVTTDGKQRYGWSYYNFLWTYIDFKGDKTVGDKTEAVHLYHDWNGETKTPINLKVVKNDGTMLWVVYSYLNAAGDKLYSGYFCDKVTK